MERQVTSDLWPDRQTWRKQNVKVEIEKERRAPPAPKSNRAPIIIPFLAGIAHWIAGGGHPSAQTSTSNGCHINRRSFEKKTSRRLGQTSIPATTRVVLYDRKTVPSAWHELNTRTVLLRVSDRSSSKPPIMIPRRAFLAAKQLPRPSIVLQRPVVASFSTLQPLRATSAPDETDPVSLT